MIGFNICSANRLISGFKIDGLGKEIYAMNLVLHTPFLSNLGIICGFVSYYRIYPVEIKPDCPFRS